MTVTVHQARIDSLLKRPNGPTADYLFLKGVRVQNTAKRLCPVDTGRLRSSIITTQPIFSRNRGLMVRVGSNVNYAIYVHNGTRFMRARPFLTDALSREL